MKLCWSHDALRSSLMLALLWLILPVTCEPGAAAGQTSLAGKSATAASAPAAVQTGLDGAPKVYAFGDVHGAYHALVAMLEALELIDARHHWAGGTARLVSLGDLLDRGPDSRQALDLLMRLEQEAAAAGGRVHLVTGNHEIMNLTGDLRYVSTAEYAAFAAEEPAGVRERATAALADAEGNGASPESAATRFPPGFFGQRAAFAPTGIYGAWLLDKPAILVLGDTAFMHGGLPAWLSGGTFDAYNQRFASELGSLLRIGNELIAAGALPRWDDLLTAEPLRNDGPALEPFLALRQSREFGNDSVHWYRGNASCHWAIEQQRLEDTMSALGVKRVVLGHTPTRTRRIAQRFDGTVILADTGMLASYYHGVPSAVQIDAKGVTAYHLIEGKLDVSRQIRPAWVDWRISARADLETRLAGLDIDAQDGPWQVDGRRFRIVVLDGSRRQRNRALAAYRLDRMLELGMVPVTVEAHGRTLVAWPENTFTETQRYAEQRYRANPCGGDGDYPLMYAWDMLIGKNLRTGDQISYDGSDGTLLLDGHQESFRASTAVPDYLAGRERLLPAGLAHRLATLDYAALEQNLGRWLNPRALKAVDARRQAMLESWTVNAAVEEDKP